MNIYNKLIKFLDIIYNIGNRYANVKNKDDLFKDYDDQFFVDVFDRNRIWNYTDEKKEPSPSPKNIVLGDSGSGNIIPFYFFMLGDPTKVLSQQFLSTLNKLQKETVFKRLRNIVKIYRYMDFNIHAVNLLLTTTNLNLPEYKRPLYFKSPYNEIPLSNKIKLDLLKKITQKNTIQNKLKIFSDIFDMKELGNSLESGKAFNIGDKTDYNIALKFMNKLQIELESSVRFLDGSEIYSYTKKKMIVGLIVISGIVYLYIGNKINIISKEIQLEADKRSGCFLIEKYTKKETKIGLLSCNNDSDFPDDQFNPCVIDGKSLVQDQEILKPSNCSKIVVNKYSTSPDIINNVVVKKFQSCDRRDSSGVCSSYCNIFNFFKGDDLEKYTMECRNISGSTVAIETYSLLTGESKEEVINKLILSRENNIKPLLLSLVGIVIFLFIIKIKNIYV